MKYSVKFTKFTPERVQIEIFRNKTVKQLQNLFARRPNIHARIVTEGKKYYVGVISIDGLWCVSSVGTHGYKPHPICVAQNNGEFRILTNDLDELALIFAILPSVA